MLHEFLNQHKNIPESNTLRGKERLRLMAKTFDGLTDFLRDPNKFPNKEINDVTALMRELVENEDIPLISGRPEYESLYFTIGGDKLKMRSQLIMPVKYCDLVREDVVMQLSVIVYMASYARDYYSGALNLTNNEVVDKRARAFAAEACLTINEMALKEGETVNWNESQRDVLKEFPNGLKSLPPELNYKTPQYMRQNFRDN